tara:strand:+ start:586 stop:786 length:201 start_codon:yes stop_codon:yes gene_type:complete
MNIFINQKLTQVPSKSTIDSIIQTLEVDKKYIAVEINEVIIPKSQYKEFIINENDKIEIINAVGGG